MPQGGVTLRTDRGAPLALPGTQFKPGDMRAGTPNSGRTQLVEHSAPGVGLQAIDRTPPMNFADYRADAGENQA
jgi:hypothetical protein